jgi:hypothetical protein
VLVSSFSHRGIAEIYYTLFDKQVLVREGCVKIALSHQVFLEYEEVLTRPRCLRESALSRSDIEAVLRPAYSPPVRNGQVFKRMALQLFM